MPSAEQLVVSQNQVIEVPSLPLVIDGQEVRLTGKLQRALLQPSEKTVGVLNRFLKDTHLDPIFQDIKSRFGRDCDLGLKAMFLSKDWGFSVFADSVRYELVGVRALNTWFRTRVNIPQKVSRVLPEAEVCPRAVTDYFVHTGTHIFGILSEVQKKQAMLAVAAVDLRFFDLIRGSENTFYLKRDTVSDVVLGIYPVRPDIFC